MDPVMRLFCLVALFLAYGCSTLSLPPVSAIVGPSASDLPDAGAVVLEDQATLSYRTQVPPRGGRKQLVAVLDHRRRIKILREAGLVEADVAIPIDDFTTVTRVRARSVNEGAYAVDLPSSGTQVVARQDTRERAAGVASLIFHIPGAKVGGVVEYRYEQVFLDPLAVAPWVFGGSLPVVHAEFGLISESHVQLDVRHGRGDHSIDRVPTRRETNNAGESRLVFVENDLPAYFDEPHGGHIAHRAPWLATAVRQVREGDQVRRFDTWGQVVAPVRRRLAAVGGEAAAGGTRQRLRQVRSELTSMAGVGLGIRTPQPADELRQGSPACSRDAAAYAIQALSGSHAAPAVVLLTGPDAPPFGEDFPSLMPFTRAVLQVDNEPGLLSAGLCTGPAFRQDFGCGQEKMPRVLVDPGCKGCSLGTLPFGYDGSRALRIDEDGEVSWITVSVGGPQRHSLWVTGKLTLDVDGSMAGALKAEARGSVAGLWRQSLMDEAGKGATVSQRPATMRLILGEAKAPHADGLRLSNVDDPEAPLTAQVQLHASAKRLNYERFVFSAADLLGTTPPAFWSGVRRGPGQLDGPRWREDSVEVLLPVGFRAELPPPVELVDDVAEYASAYSQRGRKLTYVRRLVVKAAVVDGSQWSSFHDFFGSIRAAESAAVMLINDQ